MSNSPAPAEPQLTLDDIEIGVAAVEDVVAPDPNDMRERLAVQREALDLKLARSRIKNVAADGGCGKPTQAEFYSISKPIRWSWL